MSEKEEMIQDAEGLPTVPEGAEGETIEIDLGSPNNFFIANSAQYFGIAFDKLFGIDELEVYNTFELSSKRNFKGLAAYILEAYQDLFLNPDKSFKPEMEIILFNILKFKHDIMLNKNTAYETFIGYLDTVVNAGDGLLRKTIDKFVEDNYALNLDEQTENNHKQKRKVNIELQLKDEHAKALLKISYLYRIMTPLISIYFYYNKGGFVATETNIDMEDGTLALQEEDVLELEFDEVNSKIYSHLFEEFVDKPDALRNKLYRLAESGVSKTSYSDRRFWLAAKNVALTEKGEALEIYRKLLTNAIPKLSIEKDKNVVSFLQTVINNQVEFLFQNKFKYRFIPLDNTTTRPSHSTEDNDDDDDSSVNEFERMEILSSRKDEGVYTLRKLNIQQTLDRLPELLDVGVSDAEVQHLMTYIKRNVIQEQIIALITFKYFKDKDALKFTTFYQYCYLLVICRKYLEKHKYRYLPKILTAKCAKHSERVTITGKKVKPEILSSKKYLDLLETKYANFKDAVEAPFMAFIGTVYASTFKDKDDNEIFDATIKVAKIAEEIVDLAYLI